MAIQIDMPTNEGTLSLARAIATGAKLAIQGAQPCLTEGAFGSVADVAQAIWGTPSEGSDAKDMSEYVVDGAPLIQCTSYLPALVQMDSTDVESALAA